MADNKQLLDIEGYAASKGLQVQGMDQNGVVSLNDPTGKIPAQQFDSTAFLKSKNMDPMQVQIKLNSPETAKADNALDFGDQLAMTYAHTPEQQKGLLQRQFGADNVVEAKPGEFKVKDSSGLWKKADTSWYNDLLANTPSLAAGMIGAEHGAAIGMTVGGPWGAIAGGAVGGALAAGFERYGQNKLAEVAGIRTTEDLSKMSSELGYEFMGNLLWGAGIPAAAKGLKAAAPVAKEAIANLGEKLISGTTARDWMVALRDSGTLDAVRKVASKDAASAMVPLAESGGVLPSAKMAANILVDHISSAKELAESQYNHALETLSKAKAVEVHPDALPSVYNNLVSKLSDPNVGLLKKSSTGDWVFKSYEELKNSAVGVVSESAQERLKQMFNVIKNTVKDSEVTQILSGDATKATGIGYTPKTSVSVEEMLRLKKYVRNISDDLGHFSNSSSISDTVKRVMADTSSAFDNAITPTTKNININGRSAADILSTANAKYSQYRNAYNVFSDKVADFANTNDVRKVVSKMTTEDGAQYLSAFKDLADSTGKEGMHPALSNLEIIMAGRNLASKKVSQLGVMAGGVAGGMVGGLPGVAAGGITAGLANANNVSAGMNVIAKTGKALGNAGEAVGQYTGVAKAINFLKAMSPDEKNQLLLNQNLFGRFMQSITDYQPTKDAAQQQLMQQAGGGM